MKTDKGQETPARTQLGATTVLAVVTVGFGGKAKPQVCQAPGGPMYQVGQPREAETQVAKPQVGQAPNGTNPEVEWARGGAKPLVGLALGRLIARQGKPEVSQAPGRSSPR